MGVRHICHVRQIYHIWQNSPSHTFAIFAILLACFSLLVLSSYQFAIFVKITIIQGTTFCIMKPNLVPRVLSYPPYGAGKIKVNGYSLHVIAFSQRRFRGGEGILLLRAAAVWHITAYWCSVRDFQMPLPRKTCLYFGVLLFVNVPDD